MIYKLLRNIAATSVLSLLTVSVFAQSNPQLIRYSAPRIVNFTELAQYQLAHPVKKKRHAIEQGEDRDKDFKFKPKPVPGDAISFIIKSPFINYPQTKTSADSTPAPGNVFNGIQDNGTIIPPDISGVAGNTFLMESTNQELDIFKKSGGLAVAALSLDNFFDASGGHSGIIFDPHILYDAPHQRYIVCADGTLPNNDGALFIGISQTDDPTGNWFVYALDAIGNTLDFLDYPLVGFNKKWVVVTGNDYLNSGDFESRIYVFNRDSLYAGASGTASQFSDANAFTICPAANADTLSADEYMVTDWDGNSGGQGFVQLSKITGSANSPLYSVVKTIGVNQPWNENGVAAVQKGTPHTIEAGDTRIENVVYANGSVWFTHNAFLPATADPTYIGADVWQVNPVTDSVLQFMRLADPNQQTLYYYPSVNVNAAGDVLLGYATSSDSLFPSAGYAYRAATDPVNTIRRGLIFKNGLAPYFKDFGTGRNRWGDFTYTCTDPVNNSFWTFQQFANTGENWGTVIANSGNPPCANEPVAGNISPLSDTVCGGTPAYLSLIGNTSNAEGLHVQWQQSNTGAGTDWQDINGANSTLYFSEPLFTSTFFRSIAQCTNSGLSDTTASLKIAVEGITAFPGDSFCNSGPDTLVVHATGSVNWYANQASSTPITTGDTLITNIKGDTTFYVSSGTSNQYITGIENKSIGSGSQFSSLFHGLEFTAITNCVLDSLYIYPGSAGTLKINLINASTNESEASASFTIPSSAVNQKTVLHLNMNLDGGKGYKINANGSTVKNLFRTSSGAVYPYVIPGVLSINHAINVENGYYYFFYNWHVSTGCGATRVPVSVHIDKLIIDGVNTICKGDSDVLSVTNASSVVWQPGNIEGNTITVFPQDTTAYLVSGIDSRGCALNDSFTVNVKNCVSGVPPVSDNSQVRIFPNPAMNEVNAEFDNITLGDYTVSLFNTLGQKVWETNLMVNTGSEIIPIRMASFASGVYFISITSNNQRWMRRIVKE